MQIAASLSLPNARASASCADGTDVSSSESHHHGPGGIDVPNQQAAPQKKYRQQRKREVKNR